MKSTVNPLKGNFPLNSKVMESHSLNYGLKFCSFRDIPLAVIANIYYLLIFYQACNFLAGNKK